MQRALFYVDKNDFLMTTNTTTIDNDNSWSEPRNILSDTDSFFAPGCSGLAACVDTKASLLNGIRVYFGKNPV